MKASAGSRSGGSDTSAGIFAGGSCGRNSGTVSAAAEGATVSTRPPGSAAERRASYSSTILWLLSSSSLMVAMYLFTCSRRTEKDCEMLIFSDCASSIMRLLCSWASFIWDSA